MAKPDVEKWFKSFLEQLKSEGFDLANPACSMFINDMDGGVSGKPRPALISIKSVDRKAQKKVAGQQKQEESAEIKVEDTQLSTTEYMASAVPLDKLSPEQKEKLYNLAKAGRLSITPTSADYKNIKNIEVAEGDTCKIEKLPELNPEKPDVRAINLFYQDPMGQDWNDVDFDIEKTWRASLAKEMYEHPEYFSTPELAEERANLHVLCAKSGRKPLDEKESLLVEKHPVLKVLQVEKTLTDIYKPDVKNGKADLETLLSAGVIRDEKGMPFTIGDKPWDRLDYITSEALSDKPVYVQSTGQDKKVIKIYPFKDPAFDVNKKVSEPQLVTPFVKSSAIEALKDIRKKLDEIDVSKFGKDADAIVELREKCDLTLQDLENTPFQKEFKKTMASFVEASDKLYNANVVKKANKHTLNFSDILKDIKQIGKCVEKNKDALKNKMSVEEKQRLDIAAKSVITLTKVKAQSENIMEAASAVSILDNQKEMNKQIELHMQSPAFVALYGAPGAEKSKKLLAQAAAKSSGKDLAKAYKTKETELAVEQTKRAEMPERLKQSRSSSITKGPVSPDVREDLTRMIADMKRDIDSIWHEHRTSPEFKAFKECLDMTHLRLQRTTNPYMDVKKQMASLATLADRYYISHMKKNINERGVLRLEQISKVRHMTDAIMKNQKPSEHMPLEADMLREDLAAKMVGFAAQELQKKGGADNLYEADKMLNNTRVFRSQVKAVMDSPEFRELYGYGKADAAALKEALAQKSVVIQAKLNETKKALDRVASTHPTKQEEKKKEIEKEQKELAVGV